MRSLFIAGCLLSIAPAAFAQPINYNDNTADTASYSLRPNSQYNSANTQYTNNNAKQVTTYAAPAKSGPYQNPDYDLNVGMETGYRTSDLKWNIAGTYAGTSPNVLSELQWKNVEGYEFQPKVDYTQKTGSLRGLNLQGSVNKSITTGGDNQDSDYAGDNRTSEFSRSNNDSDAGHSEGFKASVGYAFDFNDSRKKTLARFTALVGYAMQDQTFVLRDGNQTIPATGSFAGLRSSYNMEIRAPFIGAELTSNFSEHHHIKLRGEYMYGTYEGTGNWNLRGDLNHPDSYEQKANGNGYLVSAQYGWQFSPRTQFTLSSTYNYFKTNDGKDKVFFSNGTTGTTRLNEAKFQSIDYMAGLNYKF